MNPNDMEIMVNETRNLERSLGDGIKKVEKMKRQLLFKEEVFG